MEITELPTDFAAVVKSADKTVALAGNPNVGKSTIFNALTGLHQHTGNWPGKTVSTACGEFESKEFSYALVDLPGTYSLLAHSQEEEVARNFICFCPQDAAVVVCDATCLERSLNLALQVMEICPNTLICVNLLDEAKRRGISVNLERLAEDLGVPVVGTSAHDKKSLNTLTEKLDELCAGLSRTNPRKLQYIQPIEQAISIVEPSLRKRFGERVSTRFAALRLIDGDSSMTERLGEFYGENPLEIPEIADCVERAKAILAANEITADALKDKIVSNLIQNAEEAARTAIERSNEQKSSRADKILTHKFLAFPIMIAALMVIFWITIVGANYPSQWLSAGLSWVGDRLTDFMSFLSAPWWLSGILVDGAYRVLAWVVSVMLPPMAIFFPLFTLLEDLGYLPRVAYNLDKPFCKCKACGKQSLTMCMGFGCNAAGIVGCRIIDSPREKLIAMLTNVFVPCNGRFPMIITLISLFIVSGIGVSSGFAASVLSAAILTVVILLGIMMTFLVSRILSATLLKGEPSSFTLELPPFRKPQIGTILVRSLLDRTVFVLGRAAAVAAPAGAIIWILANVSIGGAPILNYITDFLDPFAQIVGMDGVILTAFLLGLPANEIVIPLIAMMYTQTGALTEIASAQMLELFTANGWTVVTAVCVIIFTLMHFPCSTSLLTIKKESGSVKWAVLAAVIPTICGLLLCAVITGVARIIRM
ncbi:MAG: ferrous iron transport protein B [Oscillospiraceae bacterium]|nr:ferrous iron transport protein B [Oscillospiraceae bacterium]